ncbi:MAG: ABC transporter ATP-binding protein [Candidatus Auribacterota bacterium]|nr:ABC transporter ATP-binding protein [Candidatus Auribacterota bacterium]
MPSIELKNINNFICRDVNLKVKDREFLVLLGPIGSGKTTLLNIIAGLIEYEGSVNYAGHSVDAIPSSERKVGYLFQELLLFPHLTVEKNIAYGPAAWGVLPGQKNRIVEEMISFFGLESLVHRYPRNLSGGEKQRVALARVLAISPEILLLDEPFSSLDFKTAKYLRMEIKRIHKKFKITTIYVTHNLVEAEEIADRIAIIHRGVLRQVGSPEEIFFNPEGKVVSDFIGKPNILECDNCRILAGGLVEVECGGISIVVPHHGNRIKKIAISPRDIYISVDEPPGPDLNRFRAIITDIITSGSLIKLKLILGENSLTSELPGDIFETLGLTVGMEVFLILKFRWIRIC